MGISVVLKKINLLPVLQDFYRIILWTIKTKNQNIKLHWCCIPKSYIKGDYGLFYVTLYINFIINRGEVADSLNDISTNAADYDYQNIDYTHMPILEIKESTEEISIRNRLASDFI